MRVGRKGGKEGRIPWEKTVLMGVWWMTGVGRRGDKGGYLRS